MSGILLLVGLGIGVAARETAWGSRPYFVWHLSTDLRAQSNNSYMSMRKGPLSGVEATCSILRADSYVGRGVTAALEAKGCVEVPEAPLSWGVQVRTIDPSCYTPLYKFHRVPFDATVNFGVLDAAGSLGGTLNLSGAVTVEAIGFLSCRAFCEHVGKQIGDRVVAEILSYRDSVR